MPVRRAARLLVLTALPAVLAATPAAAVSCPSLTDDPGDAYWLTKDVGWTGAPRPNIASLDILSADVASGPANVVAVVRVASLDGNRVGNREGEWVVGWQLDGGDHYAARVRRGLDGDLVSAFTVNDDPLGSVPFAFDVSNSTITWTIPRALMPELATPGAEFTSLAALTYKLSSTADTAHVHATVYVDQDPGCIPAS